jgi:uncharacterized protein YndB with AHSA1/START domain
VVKLPEDTQILITREFDAPKELVFTRFGEVAFHGEFKEIVPNERLVSTEVYEAMPDGAALDTLTLIEEDGLQDALDLLERVAAGLP